MRISINRLLELTGGSLFLGNGHMTFEGFSTLQEAVSSDLCFFHDSRYEREFASTQAGAVLVPEDWRGSFPSSSACIIGVPDPSRAFELAVEHWGVQPETFPAGVHPSATVSPEATFDPELVTIGPHAVISAGVRLGEGTVVGAGCFLGKGVSVGSNCILHARVTIQTGCSLGDRVILHPGVVIGADGFGYTPAGGAHRKVRQAGIVKIDDDVEIGANSTVDRARFGRTWIREGTKIDNLVQIGHNAVIGRHCLIAACSAVAGSAVLEDHVTVAGQCGIVGHVRVGARSVLGARTAVTRNLPGREVYMGFPARPAGEERRSLAAARRLPALLRRVKELEDRLTQIEKGKSGPEPLNPVGQ